MNVVILVYIYILLFAERNNYVTYVNCPKCDSNEIIKRSNFNIHSRNNTDFPHFATVPQINIKKRFL